MTERSRYGWLPGREKLFRLMPRFGGGSLRDALTLGGGTALGQIIGAASAPIITRLYLPADVGVAGLIITFVAFASVGLALRYDFAIVTAVDEIEADMLMTLSVALTVVVSGLATLVLGLLIGLNLLSFGTLPLASLLLAFPVLLCIGIFTALRYWYVRRGQFAPISKALVAQGIGRASVSISLGLISPGWAGLVFGELAGRSLGMGRLASNAWPAIRAALQRAKAEFPRVLQRNRKYPLVVLPSSLLDSAASLIGVPLIISLFGTADGGQFFLVQNLLALPAGLVANSVADVLHSRFADAYLADTNGVYPITRRALARLTKAGLAIYVPIAIVAPFLAGPLLGARWERAGLIATVLTPVVITGLISGPASRVLMVVNRPEWKLGVDIVRLVFPTAILAAGHAKAWGFFVSLLAYSAAMTVTNLIYITVVLRASRIEATPRPAQTL